MDLAIVPPAQRDGELVSDLAVQGPVLRKAQMVSICRTPAADQASLLGNRLDMLPVANPTRRAGNASTALSMTADR